MSLFMWVYPTTNGILISEQGSTTPDFSWYDAQIQRNSSGNFLFSVWPYTIGTSLITSTYTYPLNQWYYMGWTYDGTTLRGFVNGTSVGTSTVDRQTPNSAGRDMYYFVGQNSSTNMVTNPGGTNAGPASIFRFGAMKIYNRALNITEALQDYKSSLSSYLGSIPSNSLALWDALEYSGSGTSWPDSSGNGLNATLVNSPSWTSSNGSYFTFDGIDDHATAPTGFSNFTSGITVLAIVDFGSASSFERIIDFAQGQGDDNILFCRKSTTNTLTFEIYNGASQSLSVDLANGITNNGWGFYGFKANGSNYRLFNSTNSLSDSSSVLPANVSRNLNYIGESNWPGDSFFQRYIGVVAIYNRALSDGEIANFNNYYSGRYGLPTMNRIVDSGLVLKLDAGDVSSYSGSGTTWTDIATPAQNITLVGSPTYTSSSPSYFTFNGTNQYGLGSGSVIPTTSYTKSVWFYINGYQDNNLVSGDGHFIYMYAGANRIYSGHANWPSFIAYPSTGTINLNTWYNVALTFNTTDGMVLYINGVQDSTYTANKSAHPGTGTVNVGTYSGGNLLNGRISKVYCYNRSLTSAEVLLNYNADKSLFGL